MERQMRRVNLSSVVSRAALPLPKASSTEIGAVSTCGISALHPARCAWTCCVCLLLAQPCCMGQLSGLAGASHRLPALPHSLQLTVSPCPGFLQGLEPAWLHSLGPQPAFLLVTLQSGLFLGCECTAPSPFPSASSPLQLSAESPHPCSRRRAGSWQHSPPCSLPCPVLWPGPRQAAPRSNLPPSG